MTAIFFVGLMLLTCVVIYNKPKLYLWSIAVGVYYVGMLLAYSQRLDMIAYCSSAVAIGAIILFFNSPIRLKLSAILYRKAKLVLPTISETEQLALDAGDSWWERDIFQGKPNFHKLHNLPKFVLSIEEKLFLAEETTQLCSMIDDWHITRVDRDLPAAVWNFLRAKGFFGLVIKKEYGGKGFSAAAHSEIVLKIATCSASAAVTVMVPNSLGPGELLHHYGTDEQKQFYLPRLARGEEIPCFALTGPTAGSDATSIPDMGTVCMGEFNGQQVLGIKLSNINKRYITLAPIATLVGLAFQLKDPDKLLGQTGREGITCALLPHNHHGIEIGNRLIPLDQAFMNGTVRIVETFIPMDWVIGGQAMLGEGWRMLVECLSIGRSISLPTCATANAILATLTSSAYSLVREQFRVPIGTFEGIQEGLAQIGGLAYLMDATRELTVVAVDNGVRPSVASAIAKYHLTESARTTVNWAMDIHAGRGIMMGPNNYIVPMYQAVPIEITVEGANIMTRNLMIFGQGALRCHPHIRNIYDSLIQNNGLVTFDRAVFAHIGYITQNIIRAIWHAFTAAKLVCGYKKSRFNHYYKAIGRLSAALAFCSDLVLIILGGSLKFRERISARMGDALSYLYMASATLKYFKDKGELASDEVFVKWSLEYCLFNAQNALIGTLNNMPANMTILMKLIKVLLFPYGKPHHGPSDLTEKALANNLLNNSITRQNFAHKAHLDIQESNAIGRMELAFHAAITATAVKAKIMQAIKKRQLPKQTAILNASAAVNLGIITSEEYVQLALAAKYADNVIQVDEFNAAELGPKNAHSHT